MIPSVLSLNMLWGLLAGLLPIIIHLLFRQKYKKTLWAAMEFLLAALKRTQRRMRIEQLILLLIRVAILMLLAWALAGPYITRDDTAMKESRKGGSTHHIFVLDNSLSMTYKKENDTVFKIAKDKLKSLIDDMHNEDLGTLIMANDTVRVVSGKREEIRATAETANVSDASTNFTRAMEEVARALKQAKIIKQVWIITDLQSNGWLNEAGQPRDMAKTLREISVTKNTNVNIVNVGVQGAEKSLPNYLIADVKIKNAATIAKNVRTAIQVTVDNPTTSEVEAELVLAVDNDKKQSLNDKFPPGKKTVDMAYSFPTAGAHYVTVSANYVGGTDKLNKDDERYAAVKVKESIRVLGVEGQEPKADSPGQQRLLEFFASLAPQIDAQYWSSEDIPDTVKTEKAGGAAFQPLSKTIKEYESEEMFKGNQGHEAFDLVVLNGVSELSETRRQQLESYVRNGGALLIFPGDGLDPAKFNETFWNDGKGVLPLPLRVRPEPGKYEYNYTIGKKWKPVREGDPVVAEEDKVLPFKIDIDSLSHPAVIGVRETCKRDLILNPYIFVYADLEQNRFTDMLQEHAQWIKDKETTSELKERDARKALTEIEKKRLVDLEGKLDKMQKDDQKRFKDLTDKKAALEVDKAKNADEIKRIDSELKYINIRMGRENDTDEDLSRVICRFNSGDPMFIEKEYGRGRVVFSATTADASWSGVPSCGVYVVLMHELVKYLVQNDNTQNLTVGDPMIQRFSQSYPLVTVVSPDNKRHTSQMKNVTGMASTWKVEFPEPPTAGKNSPEGMEDGGLRRAGAYRLILGESGDKDTKNENINYFVVNRNPAESKLNFINQETIKNKFPEFNAVVTNISGDVKPPQYGWEFWWWLVLVVLCLAWLESILAMLFGQRSVVSEKIAGVGQRS